MRDIILTISFIFKVNIFYLRFNRVYFYTYTPVGTAIGSIGHFSPFPLKQHHTAVIFKSNFNEG